MSIALRLQGVTFAYGHAPPVLRNVDLDVERGEFVAIAGPNGGGKTTLVRLIVGLEHPASGRVELDVDNVGYLAAASAGRNRCAADRPRARHGRPCLPHPPHRAARRCRPGGRARRRRPGRTGATGGPASLDSLRRPAAAGLHREGSRGRTGAPRPRRAHDRCRRGSAGSDRGAARSGFAASSR